MGKPKNAIGLKAVLSGIAALIVLGTGILFAAENGFADTLTKAKTKKKIALVLKKSPDAPSGTVPSSGGDATIGLWTLKAGDENVHGINEICFDLTVDKKKPVVLESKHFSGPIKILVDGVALYSTTVNETHLDGKCQYYRLSLDVSIAAGKTKNIEMVASFNANAPHGAVFNPVIGIKQLKSKKIAGYPLTVSALFIGRAVSSPLGNVPAGGQEITIGQWSITTASAVNNITKLCFDINPFPNNPVQFKTAHFKGKIKILLDQIELFSTNFAPQHLDGKCVPFPLPAPITFSPGSTRQIDMVVNIAVEAPHGARFNPILGLDQSFPVSLSVNPLRVSTLTLKKSPVSRGGSITAGVKAVSVGEWTVSAAKADGKDLKEICFDINPNNGLPDPIKKTHFAGTAKILIDGIVIYSIALADAHFDKTCDFIELEQPLQIKANTSKRFELVLSNIGAGAPNASQFTPIFGLRGAYPETAEGNPLAINGFSVKKSKNTSSITVPAGGNDFTVGEWLLEPSIYGNLPVTNIQRICFDINPDQIQNELKLAHFAGEAKILVDGSVVYTTRISAEHLDSLCDYYMLKSFFSLEAGSPKKIALLLTLSPLAPVGAQFTPILNVQGVALPGTFVPGNVVKVN